MFWVFSRMTGTPQVPSVVWHWDLTQLSSGCFSLQLVDRSSIAAVWWWYLAGMIFHSNLSHHGAMCPNHHRHSTELWSMPYFVGWLTYKPFALYAISAYICAMFEQMLMLVNIPFVNIWASHGTWWCSSLVCWREPVRGHLLSYSLVGSKWDDDPISLVLW